MYARTYVHRLKCFYRDKHDNYYSAMVAHKTIRVPALTIMLLERPPCDRYRAIASAHLRPELGIRVVTAALATTPSALGLQWAATALAA